MVWSRLGKKCKLSLSRSNILHADSGENVDFDIVAFKARYLGNGRSDRRGLFGFGFPATRPVNLGANGFIVRHQ